MAREKHATIATETHKVVGTAMLNKLLSKKTFIVNNACSSNTKRTRSSVLRKSTRDYSIRAALKLGETNSKLPSMKRPAINKGDTQPLLKTQTWISKILASNPSKLLAKRRN